MNGAMTPTLSFQTVEDPSFQHRISALDGILREWLGTAGVTLACGRWDRGGIAEFVSDDGFDLLQGRYDGCFSGIREIRLPGAAHHLHVDLGRIHAIEYAVTPSVCFGYRPSFEVRFLLEGPHGVPTNDWSLSLMVTAPYRGESLCPDRVATYLARLARHRAATPDLVCCRFDPCVEDVAGLAALIHQCLAGHPPAGAVGWRDLARLARPATERQPTPSIARCETLLARALSIPDACLVIYRDRTLVEFQTARLTGPHRYEEAGHVSWQIGEFTEHHCHLALSAVTRVLFSAEPVSCQRGRLNYTLWFLVEGDCGNPYRRGGYFSITLNRPYDGEQPRMDCIGPMFDLYRAMAGLPWVTADGAFLKAMAALDSEAARCPG